MKYGLTVDIYCAAGMEALLSKSCKMEMSEERKRQVVFYFDDNPEADELEWKYQNDTLKVDVKTLKRRINDLRDRIDIMLTKKKEMI